MTGEIESLRSSLVQVRIGNKTYDAHHSPMCLTCNHPARMNIEERILQNYSYKAIVREFSEVEHRDAHGNVTVLPRIGYNSLRNHFEKGHMPLHTAALRSLSEQRATQIGSKYEDALGKFVDHYTFAEAVVSKGHERLVNGEIEPDIKETLAAAKFMKEVQDGQSANLDEEAWSQAMAVYFEVAQQMMPPEMWERFAQQLSVNPILRALAKRANNPDESVVDAEIVES